MFEATKHCRVCKFRYPKRLVLAICSLVTLFFYGTHYLTYIQRESPELFDFDFIINNEACSDDVEFLVLVHSAANHFQHRNVIRETWGFPGAHLPIIRVVFLLAKADEIQSEIERENDLHSDIVQGTFVDSYHNLTYKHAMGLYWASTYCNQTKYILKMDDDIFMDIYQFFEYVHQHMNPKFLENAIACYFQKGMPVVRDTVSKWYVSKKEFPSDIFENYCSGWAYLTTSRVAGLLYETSKTLPYFWVDDVHMTGTVAKKAKVGLVRLNKLFSLESDSLLEWTRSSENLLWDRMFGPTWGDFALAKAAHRKAIVCYVKKCDCCYRKKTTPKPTTTSTTRKGVAILFSNGNRKKKLKPYKMTNYNPR